MVESTESVVEEAELKNNFHHFDGLLPALKRLDRRLERATVAAQTAFGPEAATDRYRGLHIDQAEVERLFTREPGTPTFPPEDEADEALPDPVEGDTSRLAWLQQAFGLTLFDLDLILIALAPELDRRYERLYAYLQDHVSRQRPSVDLALNLLCPNAAERLSRRVHFAADAPLIRLNLIHLIPESNQPQTSLLAHTLKLDDQIIRFILEQENLDARLVPFTQLFKPTNSLEALPLPTEMKQALSRLIIQAWATDRPLPLYFQGPAGSGKRDTVEALAALLEAPLLVVDLAQALATSTDFKSCLKCLFREAWFHGAILFLDGLDVLRGEGQTIPFRQLLEALAHDGGLTFLAGSQPWHTTTRNPIGLLTIPFALPDFEQRRDCWQANLATVGLDLADADLDALSGRFRLTPNQIAETVAVALNQRILRIGAEGILPSEDSGPTIDELFAAARSQSGHDLATLAQKIDPVYTWDNIVLPDDALAQLREICQRVVQRRRVLGEWGFDQKLSLGKGVNALFAGPSGTGKTMAAEIIAQELALDLYKIDLAGVVSKYIGETEKNLDRIFRAAENANAILFFDEADALFGKRSEVRDSHDRYANIEISYLLQKMEAYDGLAILTTNVRQHLDEAFIRRLAFTVHFPFPDEASRRRIWAGIWPPATPLAEDVALDFMAAQFKLSGGNIKNNALAAAYLAATADSPVGMEHLLQATRREYQKMGKSLSEAELSRPASNGKS